MRDRRPRYTVEDFARLGDILYEQNVLPALRPEDDGKLVLIDIDSGDFEVDRDEIATSDRLLARRPGAQVWIRRAGSSFAHRIGFRLQQAP